MNIAWLIFVTVVIVLIQMFIFGKWGLRRVEYKRSFSKKAAFVGETIEMVDEISNRKLIPVPWLRLESKISEHLKFQQNHEIYNEMESDGTFHRSLFSLMPYQRVRRRQTLTCTKRGFYQFRTVSLTTGDIFGISEIFESVPAKAEVIVYPPLIPLEQIPLPAHSWLGDVIVRRWILEDPFLTSGVREYGSGDPLNTIHWKATARTNQLQVSKKDFSADHDLMIYLNFNQTEDQWRPIVDEELMERAISYAASIAQFALVNGISTGFGCNAYGKDEEKKPVRVEADHGKQQLTFLLETMAKLELGVSTYFDFFLESEVERNMKGKDILLITGMMTKKMRELIDQLEANGNAVEILELDPNQPLRKVN